MSKVIADISMSLDGYVAARVRTRTTGSVSTARGSTGGCCRNHADRSTMQCWQAASWPLARW